MKGKKRERRKGKGNRRCRRRSRKKPPYFPDCTFVPQGCTARFITYYQSRTKLGFLSKSLGSL